MDRKVVLAIVNGALCIDPSDVEKVDMVSIKTQLRAKYGKEIPINIAPIETWMPESGTEVLMREASDKMIERSLSALPKMEYAPSSYNNRHARRARAAMNRKR